jgi:hypothetical protein
MVEKDKKKAVVASFKIFSQDLLRGAEESKK